MAVSAVKNDSTKNSGADSASATLPGPAKNRKLLKIILILSM